MKAIVLVVGRVELLVLIPGEIVDDLLCVFVAEIVFDYFEIYLLSHKLFVGVDLLVEDLVFDLTSQYICHQFFCCVR